MELLLALIALQDGMPHDSEIVATAGPVRITTFNPVTVTGLERSTNLYFTAVNKGKAKVTLRTDRPDRMAMPKGARIRHFFAFQPPEVEIEPGATQTIEYMIANEDEWTAEIPFEFEVVGTRERVTLSVKVISRQSIPPDRMERTATLQGLIRDSANRPIRKARVRFAVGSGHQAVTAETDSQGEYSLSIPSSEQLLSMVGARRLPIAITEGFVAVEAEGFSYGFRTVTAPKNGAKSRVDFTLEAVSKLTGRTVGEVATDGVHGYWWLFPDRDFTRVGAVQGRHPPEIKEPGHVLMVDRSGKELWRFPTSTECWGFAVSSQGEVAAGGSEGTIYRVSREGKLLWKKPGGGQNREISFSPDGKQLFTGPVPSGRGRAQAALLDGATGAVVWSYSGADEWLRASRFSADGQRIAAGFSGGRLILFTRDGERLWERFVGEFPLVLEIDPKGNLYAAGKNREVSSFDAKGNLRWRRRIPDHVVTAGADSMAADGSLLVVGTVSGWLYAFDGDGTLLWRRALPSGFQGHNAVDVTPDGRRIVVGSAGERGGGGLVVVYDRHGALLWSHRSADRRESGGSSYPYDHNHIGAITVAISDDGEHVAAGYGDSTVRLFEIK